MTWRAGVSTLALLGLQQGCAWGYTWDLEVKQALDWPTPPGCQGSMVGGECCCMYCAGGPPAFNTTDVESCKQRGGQCKPLSTSAYYRGPIGKEAHASLLARSEQDPVEQTHVIGGYPDEATVVFMTADWADPVVVVKDSVTGAVKTYHGSTDTHSSFLQPAGWNGMPGLTGATPGNDYYTCSQIHTDFTHGYKNATCYYTSDYVHTVKVMHLEPARRYEYLPGPSQRWRNFTTPPAVGKPIRFGIVADLGRTMDSLSTMQHMAASVKKGALDSILFPGDLSYADGFAPAWDSYGRLSEFLFEAVPTAYTVGNHEYATGSENFGMFLPRYGWPSKERSRSSSQTWFSFEAGLAHVIFMCSYCDASVGSAQHYWLQRDLASVNRSRTPWIVALWHTPWYTTNSQHTMLEGAAMREAMEDLLYHYQVDFVFSGHVHAYERTMPVYENKTVCNGPIHITIGDGGNKEGPACPWIAGDFGWTVRREFSFGHGVLTLVNRTHAQWAWHRNQDDEAVAADMAWVQAAQYRCSKDTDEQGSVEGLLV